MERCLLVKLLHTHTKKEMNRRPLATLGHEYEGRWMARVRGSASNKSGDTHPWRRRFCSESTRSCCKCVESVERGDPPCQRKHSAFQPPLHPTANKVMRQHASCDARCNKLLHALCDYRMRPVIVYRQLVTLRLHTSGLTLLVSSLLAQITTRDGLPAPSATPTVCSRTNSRDLLFRGCRWRGQQPRQANPGLWG